MLWLMGVNVIPMTLVKNKTKAIICALVGIIIPSLIGG